jgi:single-strand DNA-binding protein
MASFAKVTLLGNLGADPETKYTPSGTMVVELRLAVNPRPRSGQPEGPPTWYRISAWDRLADRLDKLSQQGYVAKGRTLYVEGRLEPREYTANDGTQRVSYDVTMTDFNFVGGDRREGEQQGGGGSYQSNQSNQSQGGGGGGQRRGTYDDAPPADNFDDVPF